jgi:serine/threonine-protein kinase RsbW
LLPFLKERIAFQIPSDVRYIEDVLNYLNNRMVELNIIAPGDPDIMIALDEAIANAIKHGNRNDPRKKVTVIAELSAEGARFRIRDEGPGFSYREVPDPTQPPGLMKPFGRGLLLISHLMDQVSHNKRGNEIRMFKRSIKFNGSRRKR